MRKRGLIAVLALSLFLGGCMQSDQVENQAYVLTIGVDAVPEGIEVTTQVLKGTSSSDSENSYMVANATGPSYGDAIHALENVLRCKTNLNQTIMIVISEELARRDAFKDVMNSMFYSYLLDTSAWFVVCQQSAKEFISVQKPVIGTRLSIAITSALQNHVDLGFVPDASFSDAFYSTASSFADPLAIYGSTKERYAKPEDQQTSLQIGGADTPSALTASSDAENIFLGAVLFRDGRMIDTLTGDEVLCLNLIQGGVTNFSIVVDGHTAYLSASGMPILSVDTSTDQPLIKVRIALNMENNTTFPEPERVKEALLEQMHALTRHCQELQVDPFGYAIRASLGFPTLDAWNDYHWRERFAEAKCEYDLSIRLIDA